MNSQEKVLVIDDEVLIRDVLRSSLEGMGLVAVEAEDGKQGLKKCLELQPDLVLLDVSMPGMSGFETCRAIKSHPDITDIPVLFLTGRGGHQDLMEGFASGAVDFIIKPFHINEIRARIQAHLQIRRQRREIEQSHAKLEGALAEIKQDHLLLLEVNEKLRTSEAVQSHFLAHVRNEINDPLSSILGLADQIGDPRLSIEQCKDAAIRIKEEAFQLDFQLRNIFCAAALEAGEATPYLTQVDVESVLMELAVTFEQRVHAHSLRRHRQNMRLQRRSPPIRSGLSMTSSSLAWSTRWQVFTTCIRP